MDSYSSTFYKERNNLARKSAEVIVPWIMELLQPKSVIDIGCGTGSWVSVFQDNGVDEFLGVDGEWVKSEYLEIPEDHFQKWDLCKPYCSDRQYDLVVSLEVAEHLPQECAETFIRTLVQLGRVIMFSAAIPKQSGTNHVNEQWPDYWIELFQRYDYVVVDCIRGRFWDVEDVAPWYLQNTFLFVHNEYLHQHRFLLSEEKQYRLGKYRLVHPRHFLLRVAQLTTPPRYTLAQALNILLLVLKRNVTRIIIDLARKFIHKLSMMMGTSRSALK
jgi:SAM-dependent methyltransferase